ncbi:MAG: transcriptional regulator, TraR/DksA family [uncultured bacterium]|nr:MAG: transcriptional regulator, TraR/DksA family [uncultured bacterium]
MALDKTFVAEAKKLLLEEQARLTNELGRLAKPTGIPGDYETTFEDMGDHEDENASEVEEYTDKLALENNLEKQLRETTEALERVEAGTYGYCENCQKDIPLERLRAYPSAKTCLHCN